VISRPDRRWGPPSLLYNGYRVFPGGKTAGRGVDHPPTPLSSAEVKERIDTYLYFPSGPSWTVLGVTLLYLYLYQWHHSWRQIEFSCFIYVKFSPKFMVEWLALLIRIREDYVRIWGRRPPGNDKFFVVSFNHLRQIRGWYFKLRHDRLLSHPSQLIKHELITYLTILR